MKGNGTKEGNAADRQIKWIYSLSPMQHGMLYHSIVEKSAVYFEQWEFTLGSSLDVSLLEKSFNRLIDRYDILRTVFVYEGLQEPMQVVLRECSAAIHFEDLGGLDENDRCLHVETFKRKDKEKGFDLSKDLLIRLALFKRGEHVFTMVFSYHHILMDGWCLGIIFRELLQFYRSYEEGTPLQMEPVPAYRDYIQWLNEQDKESGLRYWAQYLEGCERRTGVPKSRKAVEDEPPAVEEFDMVFDERLSAGIRQFARENQVTVNNVFQTLWGIVLQRYNDCGDVVYGVVVSGRPPEIGGVERMVGLFINTVPLRVNSRENRQFLQLLKNVHCDGMSASPYEYLPLAEIQANSALKMELIDHILVFENLPVQKELDDVPGQGKMHLHMQAKNSSRQTNYDFNIIIEPFECYSIKFSYNSRVYDGDFIKRVASHLERTAVQVLNDPGLEIAQLELVAKDEKQRLLVAFNDTDRKYPREKSVLQMFEAQATRTPYRIAVAGRDGKDSVTELSWKDLKYISYDELNRRADRLAGVLRQKGAGAGAVVAISLERSIEMVVAIWAVLKAGGVYLPLEPGYPEARVRRILRDSQAQLVLTGELSEEAVENICPALDPADLDIYRGSPEGGNSEINHRPGNPMYVLYTSGSTGIPRGVIIEHGAVVNIVTALFERYPLGESDAYLLKTSCVFDVSVTEYFGWFLQGGRLVILERGAEKDPYKMIETIRDFNITHLNFVPSMFNAFVNTLTAENMAKLSSLDYIFLAGEALFAEPVTRFRSLNPSIKLENIYGPTEATIYAAGYSLNRWNGLADIPIGKPLANIKLYILDKQENLQPIGIPGELWISGVGVARGYLNEPGLTREKFALNPFDPGARFYKTGDLARWLADGNIEFMGRLDQQMKIRGFRIEPGEIENQLLKLAKVAEALVIDREEPGERYLAAYIVLQSSYRTDSPASGAGEPAVALELKDHLARHLPGYMIPAHYVFLDKIPLTMSGKVDRKALPEPQAAPGAQYTPPRNEIERKLVKIWTRVLRVDERLIGIDSDFFLLGGHSLKSIIMVSLVQKELDVKLAVGEIFKRATIRRLAKYIKKSEQFKYFSIEPVEKKECYPLGPAQGGIYLLHHMFLENTSYNLPEIWNVEGYLARERLEDTIWKILRRHEILRTSFELIGDNVSQRIREPDNITFKLEYYETRDREVVDDIVHGFVRPFDLARAPLLRGGLIKMEPNRFILMLDTHHIISDGISMKLLIQELVNIYLGKPVPLPHLHYKDFSQWQNRWLEEEEGKRQEAYWLEQFRERPPLLNLPLDYPRPSAPSYEANSFNFEIDSQLTLKIRKLTVETQTTLFMVLLAVYYILWFKYTMQEDIVVGTPFSGRNYGDTQGMIGMFAGIIPLRNRPQKEKSFIEFLEDVKNNVLNVFENQDYQYENLLRKLGLHGNSRALFNVAFTVSEDVEDLNKESSDLKDTGNLKLTTYSSRKLAAKYDLSILGFGYGEVIRMSMQYDRELFKLETIERISTYYLEVLKDVVENREKKLADIKIPHQLLLVESHTLLKELDEFEF